MKIGRKEFVYLTGYSLYLSAISFIYNIAPSLSKFFKGGGICLILIALLMDPIPIKKIMFRAVVACLVAMLSIKASAFSTAIFFLFTFAFYQVSFKRLLKIDFIIRTFGIAVSTVMYMFGFAADNILIRYSTKGALIRHSMGYVHPNTAFLMIFIALLDYLIICYWNKTLNPVKIILALSIAYVYQWQTGSRSSFVVLCGASVLLYLELRYSITSVSIINKSICGSSLIALCVSLILTKIYDSGGMVAVELNRLMTSRLSSMSYFWNTYGTSLFGTQTVRVGTLEALNSGTRAYILDNFYMNLLVSYGLVFTVVFLYLVCTTSKKLVEVGHSELAIVWCMFCLLGITEGAIINIDYNFFAVTMVVVLYYKYFNKEMKKKDDCARRKTY